MSGRSEVVSEATEQVSELPDAFITPSGRELRVHQLAKMMPPMSPALLMALRNSIESAGKNLVPVLINSEGEVLDGRHRLLVCGELGIEPETVVLDGAVEPIDVVIGSNEARRHLNDSQRALVAARLATLGHGRPAEKAQFRALSQDEAAEKLGVSRTQVQSARRLIDRAIPGLIALVERGSLAVSAAAAIAGLNHATQRKLLQSGLPAMRQRAGELRRRDTRNGVETAKADCEKVGEVVKNTREAEPRADRARASGATPNATDPEKGPSGDVAAVAAGSSLTTHDDPAEAEPTADAFGRSSPRQSGRVETGEGEGQVAVETLCDQGRAHREENESHPADDGRHFTLAADRPLRVRAELADPTTFDLEAWIWLELEPTFEKFRSAAVSNPALRRLLVAEDSTSVAYSSLVARLLNVPHPDRWAACAPCDGGRDLQGPCPCCDARGYEYRLQD